MLRVTLIPGIADDKDLDFFTSAEAWQQNKFMLIKIVRKAILVILSICLPEVFSILRL